VGRQLSVKDASGNTTQFAYARAMIRLERHPTLSVDNPTLHSVMSLVADIERDNSLDDAPEFEVSFRNEGSESRLCVYLLYGLPKAAWMVGIDISTQDEFMYLATSAIREPTFVTVTRCGVVERIRKECVLEGSLIKESAQWFLLHGTPNPSLVWLNSSDVFQE
jgi:hypothetical protein